MTTNREKWPRGLSLIAEIRPLVIRGLLAASALLAFMLIDSFIEPAISPWSIVRLLSSDLDEAAARIFLAALARLAGFILASAVTLCGIVIPLTANNYTPKLIILFVKDRVNWAMFALLVGVNAIIHWTLLATIGAHMPRLNLGISAALAFVALFAMVPYVFYLFRTLLPETIIAKIESEVLDDIDYVARTGELDHGEVRRRIFENIKYISNIVLRSIDRHDRDTALIGIETLRRLFDLYLTRKALLPTDWFSVSSQDFLAKPAEALEQIEECRAVFEVELLEEYALILAGALGRFREGVRMLGVSVRHFALRAVQLNDRGAANIACTYLNSFLRAAISAKNPDAIYMLVFQYRQLAESLLAESPDDAARVAFFLDYYAHQAVRSGIVFVANVIAYDLAALVELAWDQESSIKDRLFELFINFDRNGALVNFPGVVKSHIKLLIVMESRSRRPEADRLVSELMRVERQVLIDSIAEIESVRSPFYWEITDRRRHMDYIDPERIATFEAIKARLLALAKARANDESGP